MNNEFSKLGLYDHNAQSYIKVRDAFNSGENVVGIVHATGTGKSYNALQLAYDNPDKKVIYVVPSNGIIEHLKKIIDSNENLDFERDFPNLEFRTYQSFINLSREEIEDLDVDLLILDEFHHIGAPVWGNRIDTIIETHPDIKVFGMTAYTVRDRGTSYERDMANPDTDEIFSGKIVSRYDLCDAMIEGVLPKPVYKSAYTNLIGLESKLEEKVLTMNATSKEYQEYMAILNDIKKRISEAPGIAEVVRKNVKPDGKYIYFCPPCSLEGTNDIETIKKEALGWFKKYVSEEDIIFYTTTSEMGEEGKLNREAFYEDMTLDGKSADGKLRIMFAINQYNEGVHAPNIDGVIMGRGTTSDIVYFEQLGRALSVRGNTKERFEEYEKYSIDELIEMCKERDILVKNYTKEEIIQTLLAPTIIDLTNNFDFISELENNLKDRFKQIQSNGGVEKRIIKIRDASFDIDILNQDLFEMLKYLRDRLVMTWEDKYELAKAYYEHHKTLEMPYNFKTINGYEYEENGIHLGEWIGWQRKSYKNNTLSEERKKLLLQIGMRFENKVSILSWEEWYELAKTYYEHVGDLKISSRFKTTNGYEYDENGISLGNWVFSQKKLYRKNLLTKERKNLLLQIGIEFEVKISNLSWEEWYELAKAYYVKNQNLETPKDFRTMNGYEYDENGDNLYSWLIRQRACNKSGTLTEERKNLLLEIGMKFENQRNTLIWEEWYELAKNYYNKHQNLEISKSFKTLNGYEYNKDGVNLGSWILSQRNLYKKKKLTLEEKNLLSQIGMIWNENEMYWYRKYELARAYYENHGNLEITQNFKTKNGYEYDEKGVHLGEWIQLQRKLYKNNKLPLKRKSLLLQIGMNFENKKSTLTWKDMYKLAKTYYEKHYNLEIPYNFKTKNGYEYDEKGSNLGKWIGTQRQLYKKSKLTEERKNLLLEIGMIFDVRETANQIIDICNNLNIDYEKNKKVIEHISIQEFESKLKYLNENNISIVDLEGKLHEIFSMSSLNIQMKYGVSLEELIKKYIIDNQSKKGL